MSLLFKWYPSCQIYAHPRFLHVLMSCYEKPCLACLLYDQGNRMFATAYIVVCVHKAVQFKRQFSTLPSRVSINPFQFTEQKNSGDTSFNT